MTSAFSSSSLKAKTSSQSSTQLSHPTHSSLSITTRFPIVCLQMVLFQEFNNLAAAEFWFSISRSRQATGSSLTLQYNKFAGGKYKGRDLNDPQHF
jgi:hypothetical protein